MALTKTVLTGRFPFANDVVPAYAVAKFTLSGFDVEGDDVVIPPTIEVTLVNGVLPAAFSLWANTAGLRGTYYSVVLVETRTDANGGMPVEHETKLANIQIPSTPSTRTIAWLLNNPVPSTQSWNVNISGSAYAELLASIASANAAAVTATAQAGVATAAAASIVDDVADTAAAAVEATAQAAIATAQAGIASSAAASIVAEGILPLEFAARSALVSAISGGLVPLDGVTYRARGMDYIGASGATAIADLPGLRPGIMVYPDHYAENATPGTTDMGPAIQKCLDNYGSCNLLSTTYATGQTIAKDNCTIRGAKSGGGIDGFRSRILGLSASLAVGEPILKIGRTSSLLDFDMGYDTLTGSEIEGERVGLDCAGVSLTLQRGSRIDGVRPINCGTAIIGLPFSVTIGTMEVGAHSFCGIDCVGVEAGGPTGNFWQNVYINDGNTYTPSYGARFGAGISFAGVVGQINVEHGSYEVAPIAFYNAAGLQVLSLHIEGCKLLNGSTDFIRIEGPQPIFGTITVIHNGAWGANCGLVGFGETAQSSAPSATLSRGFVFKADKIEVRGLLRPNTLPAGYPTGTNDWVSRIPGWRWLSRRDGGGGLPVTVEVDEWNFAVYPAWNADAEEVRRYRNPWYYSLKTGLQLRRIGSAGPTGPSRNLLRDPDAELIDGGTVYSATTQFATDWLTTTFGAVGSVTVSKGINGVSYILDPGIGAAFQAIQLYGKLPARFRGGYLTAYADFEDVDGAGAGLVQMRVAVFNRSGSSRLNEQTAQIVGAITVPAGGGVPYSGTTSIDLSAFTFGADPHIGLWIQANDATVVNTARVRVRNIVLSVGVDNPALAGLA